MQANKSVLALDIGGRRIGVAIARAPVYIATPLITLEVTERIHDEIAQLATQEDAGLVVIGLPRGLEGQDTPQTTATRKFASQLESRLTVPMVYQDEAATSLKAEQTLEEIGKGYVRGQIDSLAATYILEDYIATNREKLV